MEEPRLKHEIGDDDPAPAPTRAAVATDLDGSTDAPLKKLEIRDDAPAPAAAVIGGGGGDLIMGALQELIDREGGGLHPAAAGAGGEALLGGALQLQQLVVELGVSDRRLQAACFFLAWGCCVLIYGMVLNPSTNWEHIFVGFLLTIIGIWFALLTLVGAGAGRAAARAEGFLRDFF